MRKLLAAAAVGCALAVVGAPTPTLAAPSTVPSVSTAVTHTMHSCGWKHHSM
ncbi:MAG: hypothetical protein ACRDPB_07740 [Nocardioidaceae bacterium]